MVCYVYSGKKALLVYRKQVCMNTEVHTSVVHKLMICTYLKPNTYCQKRDFRIQIENKTQTVTYFTKVSYFSEFFLMNYFKLHCFQLKTLKMYKLFVISTTYPNKAKVPRLFGLFPLQFHGNN